MASTVTNGGEKVLYSPTSPVVSEGSLPSPAGDVDDATATATAYDDLVNKETETEAVLTATGAPRREAPRPLLLIGPRFDKELPLNPNRWVRMGRSKKAQLLLDNTGVSRNHCAVRWDRHRQAVEVKDTSTSGTLVNGEATKGMRRTVTHGDRIRIEGKGMRYDFILDLRPVGLGLSDPRQERAQPWKGLKGPALKQRRDALRAQLAHLDSGIAKCEREAFTKEKEFYDIVTRRSMRAKEDAEREDNFRKYTLGAQVLEQKIKDSRDEWFARLQGEWDANERATAPMIEKVAVLQTKVEKLQLKKDELERSIHPERYAIADVSRVGSFSLDVPSSQKTRSHTPSLDNEGEDDPLAMLSGHAGSPSKGSPSKATDAPTTPGAGKRPASPWTGDEPEVKSQKLEDDDPEQKVKYEQKVEDMD